MNNPDPWILQLPFIEQQKPVYTPQQQNQLPQNDEPNPHGNHQYNHGHKRAGENELHQVCAKKVLMMPQSAGLVLKQPIN
jgi:hypothetical protein